MNRVRYFFAVLFVWPVLSGHPAEGHVISIQAQVQTKIQGETLVAVVKVTNLGDEEAKSVHVRTQAPRSEDSSENLPTLSPGAAHSFTIKHSLKGLTPGVYPLIIFTHYGDSNNYPFSALSITGFQWGRASDAGVIGSLENVEIRGHGRSELKLKNLENSVKSLHIRFLAPSELSFDPKSVDIQLAPDQEINLPCKIRNFSALRGSTYFVYAVMEFEQGGVHATAWAPASIRIGEPGIIATFSNSWPPLAIGFLVLAMLIAARIYWAKRSSR
jgi:hypothetical protein